MSANNEKNDFLLRVGVWGFVGLMAIAEIATLGVAVLRLLKGK